MQVQRFVKPGDPVTNINAFSGSPNSVEVPCPHSFDSRSTNNAVGRTASIVWSGHYL